MTSTQSSSSNKDAVENSKAVNTPQSKVEEPSVKDSTTKPPETKVIPGYDISKPTVYRRLYISALSSLANCCDGPNFEDALQTCKYLIRFGERDLLHNPVPSYYLIGALMIVAHVSLFDDNFDWEAHREKFMNAVEQYMVLHNTSFESWSAEKRKRCKPAIDRLKDWVFAMNEYDYYTDLENAHDVAQNEYEHVLINLPPAELA